MLKSALVAALALAAISPVMAEDRQVTHPALMIREFK
jgi:hypothetical protein